MLRLSTSPSPRPLALLDTNGSNKRAARLLEMPGPLSSTDRRSRPPSSRSALRVMRRRLLELGCLLPVIIVTGHGDVTLARQAFKAQASDFLEKPFDHDKLLAAIDEAFSREAATRGQLRRQQEGLDLLRTLTPREREVMQLVVTGRHNRDIAPVLGISVRTVEVHKARVMDKLGVDNVADLVRISMLATD